MNCDCGADKAQTPHVYWCKTQQFSDKSWCVVMSTTPQIIELNFLEYNAYRNEGFVVIQFREKKYAQKGFETIYSRRR